VIQRAQEDAFAGCARAVLLLSDNRWVLDCMAPHRLVGEGDRAMGRCPGHDLRTRQSSAAVSGLLQTAPPATAHDVGQRGALAARERETTMTTITLKALLEVLLGMQGTFVLRNAHGSSAFKGQDLGRVSDMDFGLAALYDLVGVTAGAQPRHDPLSLAFSRRPQHGR